jgi:hypothetical protein
LSEIQEELPLRPRTQEEEKVRAGVGVALLTFGASALLGLGTLVLLLTPNLVQTRGATRSAQLRRLRAQRSAAQEIEAAKRSGDGSF